MSSLFAERAKLFLGSTFESHSLLFVLHFHKACCESCKTLQGTRYHITLAREPTHVIFFNFTFHKRGEITPLGNKIPQSFSKTVKYGTCLPVPLRSSQAANSMTGNNRMQEHQHRMRKGIFSGTVRHDLLSGTLHQRGMTLSK